MTEKKQTIVTNEYKITITGYAGRTEKELNKYLDMVVSSLATDNSDDNYMNVTIKINKTDSSYDLIKKRRN